MLVYPQIDPVAFSIGSIDIRWYGIAYASGILLGWFCLIKLIQRNYFNFDQKIIGDFIPWATMGIVVGGRLGHVVLYNLDYYWHYPWEIIMIWRPGMAFHGGVVGIGVATLLFCHRYKVHFLQLADAISVVAPLGIFFGRIANFINAELWGRVSYSWLAMVFPNAGNIPRHPSQLYEAFLEGIVIFVVQLYLVIQRKKLFCSGFLTGTFLTLYALARIIVEYFRYPEDGYLWHLTVGQMYSVPMALIGLWLLRRAVRT